MPAASPASASSLTLDQLRPLVDLADERAANDDERALVTRAYELLPFKRGDAPSHAALEAVLALQPIALRSEVTCPRALTVASDSTPGVSYELRRIGSTWFCSCLGFKHRSTCKHVAARIGGAK